MTELTPAQSVTGLLIATAEAHHEATGGSNDRWARWYAEHMLDDLNGRLQTRVDTDELERWLIAADERYRNERQAESWPKVYARWLLEDYPVA